MQATGSFEVKLAPLPTFADDEPTLGRRSIEKTFRGDLEATSRGEMLTAGGTVPGSAMYVAVERVTGSLSGRTGSFSLAHVGTMNRGTPSLTITVVPDSGTGDLAGISGSMEIVVEAGKHSYAMSYDI